jgi:hypothetical protein
MMARNKHRDLLSLYPYRRSSAVVTLAVSRLGRGNVSKFVSPFIPKGPTPPESGLAPASCNGGPRVSASPI